jgi:hypothetical protein
MLQFRKPAEPAAPALSPHRQALRDNLLAIRAAREKVNTITERDRQLAAEIAAAEATEQQIATLEDTIDRRRADAMYHGNAPPDVSAEEKKLVHLQQVLKSQMQKAREAGHVRARLNADVAALNDQLVTHARANPRLLWVALREDCLPSLSQEYLEKEAAFLDVRRRAFGAASACDAIAREQAYGEFCGAALGADFRIPRPAHDAFNPNPLTPEQSYTERREYSLSIATAAKQFMDELLDQDVS